MNEQQIIDIAQKVLAGALNVGDQLVTEVIRFMVLESLMTCVAAFVCFAVCWAGLNRAVKFISTNPANEKRDDTSLRFLINMVRIGVVIGFTLYSAHVAKPTLKWLAAPHLALAELALEKKLELEKKP